MRPTRTGARPVLWAVAAVLCLGAGLAEASPGQGPGGNIPECSSWSGVTIGDTQADAEGAWAAIEAIISRPRNVEHTQCQMNGKTVTVPPDLSHRTFDYLFGDFIWAPWTEQTTGTKSTLLARALGFTNIVAILMAAVIMTYVMVGGSINTASSGIVLGRDWDNAWMPVRNMASLGLIFPASTLGGGILSTVQILVIWLLIIGSNMATSLWEYILGQVAQGTTIHNVSRGVSSSDVESLTRMMLCARAWTNAGIVETATKERHGNLVFLSKPVYQIDSSTGKPEAKWFKKEYLKGDADKDKMLKFVEVAALDGGVDEPPPLNIHFGPNGSCGEIDLPSVPPDSSFWSFDESWEDQLYREAKVFGADIWPEIMGYAWDAAGCIMGEECGNPSISKPAGMRGELSIEVLHDAYKKQLQGADEGDDPSGLERAMREHAEERYKAAAALFWKAFETYNYSVNNHLCTKVYAGEGEAGHEYDPRADSCGTGNESEPSSPHWLQDWQAELAGGGWMRAGMWYFELARIETISAGLVKSMEGSIPTFSNPDEVNIKEGKPSSECTFCGAGIKEMTYSVFAGKLLFDLAYRPEIVSGVAKAGRRAEKAATSSSGLGLDLMDDSSLLSFSWGIRSILRGSASDGNVHMSGRTVGASQTAASNLAFDAAGVLANPFVTVSEIGETMKTTAIVMWFAGLAKYMFLSSNEYGARATGWGAGFAGMLRGGMEYLFPQIMATTTLLFTSGISLAYLVPLMPLLTWIMMLGSYLLSVVEAVMGAPLAVVMMATPEGKGIAGTKMQTAIQLLAVAIMNPTLMIIGLVVSFSVSGILFFLLNTLYRPTLMSADGLVKLLFITCLYIFMAMWVCKFCVSIMYKLPQQILDWFATGAGKRLGESIDQGGVESFSQSFDTSVGQMQMAGLSQQDAGFGRKRAKPNEKGEDPPGGGGVNKAKGGGDAAADTNTAAAGA